MPPADIEGISSITQKDLDELLKLLTAMDNIVINIDGFPEPGDRAIGVIKTIELELKKTNLLAIKNAACYLVEYQGLNLLVDYNINGKSQQMTAVFQKVVVGSHQPESDEFAKEEYQDYRLRVIFQAGEKLRCVPARCIASWKILQDEE